jgi:DNA helicase II / ATP-dependent DNA helicase PcrA
MSLESDPLLDGLNPQQRAAVLFRGQALLIVAGAGSGKTSVLTRRIVGLLRNREAWPSQILAITFTNKAAGEMRERISGLVGEAATGMWISTFHSACVRILRKEAERFGYSSSFTIYDSADQRALVKRILKELDGDDLGLTHNAVINKMSRLKNELADVDSYRRTASSSDPADALFVEVWDRYQRELARSQAFDFDDLIGQTVYLLRAFPDVAARYQSRFRHVLVDEYQDTNHAQYSLIRELTRDVPKEYVPEDSKTPRLDDGSIAGASLTVVGDSDQSIYAFRGADIRNITEFERDFPGAEVILLEQNYRSTQTILDAANAVIGNNFDRTAKKLFTDVGAGEGIIGFTGYSAHDEAQFVADQIVSLSSEGIPYSEMAIFYRTNAQTRALEDILIRSGIPYRVIGGTKFYERAEIKDVMAYLVAIANPADSLALRRILNTPRRGIGPATETALVSFADKNGITLREALTRSEELGLGPKVTQAMQSLGEALDAAEQVSRESPPVATVETILTKTGYLSLLQASRDPQDEARAENVQELVAVTREFGKNNPDGTLVDFLTEVSLVAAADDLDDESGTVSLMTLHTAKGLEFDVVFLTGVEEDLLPHRMSAHEPGGLQEERRLLYVGITRARKRLHLSLAMTRSTFGDTAIATPSRFLGEIPQELITWRESQAATGGQGHLLGSSVRSTGWQGSSSRGSRSIEVRDSLPKAPAKNTEWANRVTSSVRDNGDLTVAPGDRISHDDFGEGSVVAVTGEGKKRIAEVQFDTAGRKRLLIKIAPITKL